MRWGVADVSSVVQSVCWWLLRNMRRGIPNLLKDGTKHRSGIQVRPDADAYRSNHADRMTARSGAGMDQWGSRQEN